MRIFEKSLLAGAAAIAMGLSGSAMAQSSDTHVMTVRLPDGGLAQIRYVGDVAPRVVFDPTPIADAFAPMPSLFGRDSPFAMMDRISAEMDRQAAAMFRQAEVMTNAAQSGPLTEAAARNMPAGGESYSFISTSSGNGVCSQSVEITSIGNGAAPRVVRHSSGNCGGVAGSSGGAGNIPTAAPPVGQPAPVWTNAPAARPVSPGARPDVVWTSAPGATPYAGLVREIPAAQQQR